MTITRMRTTTITVQHQYVSKDGMTVGDLRKFLRQADEAGLDDITPVEYDHKLTHEGSAYTGMLRSSVKQTEDVPLVADPREERP